MKTAAGLIIISVFLFLLTLSPAAASFDQYEMNWDVYFNPPNVTDVYSIAGYERATVYWYTDYISHNRFYYGTDETDVDNGVNGQWSTWDNNTLFIEIPIYDLETNTTYYFKPESRTIFGLVNNTVDVYNFTTRAEVRNFITLDVYILMLSMVVGAGVMGLTVFNRSLYYFDFICVMISGTLAYICSKMAINESVCYLTAKLNGSDVMIKEYIPIQSLSLHYVLLLVFILSVLYMVFMTVEFLYIQVQLYNKKVYEV